MGLLVKQKSGQGGSLEPVNILLWVFGIWSTQLAIRVLMHVHSHPLINAGCYLEGTAKKFGGRDLLSL